jgi:hypothetical protein
METAEPSDTIRQSVPLPLGYSHQETVKIDPVTGPLVRQAFVLLRKQNASLRSVLSVVTTEGLRSRHGNPLKYSSFYDLITNPFYAGYVRQSKKLVRGTHQPLVSDQEFWEVQGRLRERATRTD